MKRALIGFAAACSLLAIHASDAAAQDALTAATKWGLLGTWSVDCNAKPSSDNGAFTYARQGKGLVMKRDFGPGNRGDTNEIVSALLTADGGIELAIYFKQFTPPQMRTQRFLKEGGGYRPHFNRDQHDNYSVRDSKFTGSGAPTKVINKCKG